MPISPISSPMSVSRMTSPFLRTSATPSAMMNPSNAPSPCFVSTRSRLDVHLVEVPVEVREVLVGQPLEERDLAEHVDAFPWHPVALKHAPTFPLGPEWQGRCGKAMAPGRQARGLVTVSPEHPRREVPGGRGPDAVLLRLTPD